MIVGLLITCIAVLLVAVGALLYYVDELNKQIRDLQPPF